jgi:hypothetical protein
VQLDRRVAYLRIGSAAIVKGQSIVAIPRRGDAVYSEASVEDYYVAQDGAAEGYDTRRVVPGRVAVFNESGLTAENSVISVFRDRAASHGGI